MDLNAYFDFLDPDDISIKGTRIGIESILYEYIHRGQPPEAIAERFHTRWVIDPHSVFCPNMDCPARGPMGAGNRRMHRRKRPRYRCRVGGTTCRARAGALFCRRRTDEDTITRVVTLVRHGGPVVAIEAAAGFQAQTVRAWMDGGGTPCWAVHQAEVVRARARGQVQAAEIHGQPHAGVLGMALARLVSTRLWLGGARRARRDPDLLGRLVAVVAACASYGPRRLVTDGLKTYIDGVRKAFRTRQAGTGGRPRLVGWPDLVITQVVKPYAGRALPCPRHWRVHGSGGMSLTLRWSTPGCQVRTTAFIERLHGTFRSRLAVLGRRTRCARQQRAVLACERWNPIADAAGTPDGWTLATAGDDRHVNLWRVDDGALLRTLERPARVQAVAFTPDGRTLAAGGSGGTIVLWRVDDGRLLQKLTSDQRDVVGLAFMPGGHMLVAAHAGSSVAIWRLTDGTVMLRIANQSHGTHVPLGFALSPDGTTIALDGMLWQGAPPEQPE